MNSWENVKFEEQKIFSTKVAVWHIKVKVYVGDHLILRIVIINFEIDAQ